MKKLNLLLLTLLALWGATATADVVFDETNFPDETFRDMIKRSFYEDYSIEINEGDVLDDELLNMELIMEYDGYTPYEFKIHSIEGIQFLSGIISLELPASDIEYIDLSHNINLTYVYINQENPIKYINIDNCIHLKSLNLPTQYVNILDLSQIINLKKLSIFGGNPEIIWPMGSNQIDHLMFEDCQIQQLDISNFKQLQEIQCINCPELTDISFFKPNPVNPDELNLGLRKITFINTGLTSLDVSDSFWLRDLLCQNNIKLRSIDASGCSLLNSRPYVSIYNNPLLSSIDLSNCISMLDLQLYGNNELSSLNLDGCTNLKDLYIYDSSRLQYLNLSSCISISDFKINLSCLPEIINGIESIYNTLERFSLRFSNVTTLSHYIDFSQCPNLSSVNIYGTHFNAIDLDGISLTSCNVSNNGRTIPVLRSQDNRYYIPVATTSAQLGIKDLIEQENNYEDEDTGFDWINVVTDSITGATLGELDGEQVLWLDPTTTGVTEGLHRMTYQYLTHCPNDQYATVVFYLDWTEATGMTGDVNDDGRIAIDDVTALISYLLSGDATGINLDNADVNSDGGITIADVTTLIDILLTGNN